MVLAAISISLLAVSLLPLWRHPHWTIRVAGFARIQLACLAALCLALLLIQASFQSQSPPGARPALWLCALLASLLCLLWNVKFILPYTPFWRAASAEATAGDPPGTIRILTANVLMTNRAAPELLALVHEHDPDVVITLETDDWWQEQLGVLTRELPHTLACPLDNLYGMHLFSRLPIENSEIAYLVHEDVPSFHLCLRMPCGTRVTLHVLHPRPPSPTESATAAPRDAELVAVARRVAQHEGPVIVAGDLNDVPWSITTSLFRRISGLLDPRIGRGLFNTYHAQIPFIRWPLDHLYHSEHFVLAGLQRLPGVGSDHFPLLTTLSLTGGTRSHSRPASTDADDRARADAITAAEGVTEDDVPAPGKE